MSVCLTLECLLVFLFYLLSRKHLTISIRQPQVLQDDFKSEFVDLD